MESTASHPRLSRPRLASPPRCKSGRSRCRPIQNHKRSLHRNQQYSITALTDASGTVSERYTYTAYGTPTITDASGTTRTTTATGNRYTYTGREWDETLALYHYRARMYDSVAGRFASRDPIGLRGSSLNLSEYVDGRPYVGIDPFGKYFVCAGLSVGVGVFVGAGPIKTTVIVGGPPVGIAPFGLGISVSGSCSFCAGYSRKKGCYAGNCCGLSMTFMPLMAGGWLSAGGGPVVTLNAIDPTSNRPEEGLGVSTGVGVGVEGGGSILIPEITVDVSSNGDTVINLPRLGFSHGAYVGVRINVGCTACSPQISAKLRACLSMGQKKAVAAIKQLRLGVPATSFPGQITIPGPPLPNEMPQILTSPQSEL